MAEPTTRQEMIDTCKRRLGHPVVNIDVTEEQFDDRVDEALSYYYDYHFSGSEQEYYKHVVTANNRPDRVYDLTVYAGGTAYSNADTISISGDGTGATGTITTDGNGVITTATLTASGNNYATTPTVSISTGTGSGGSITAELGGFIPMPENIIGAIRVFPIGHSNAPSNNMFSIKYQIVLNDIYTLTTASMVPYFSAFQHLEFIQDLLVGEIPIRYNRHKNRLYLDMNWEKVIDGQYVLVEAYKIVNPAVYTDVYKDRWLLNYLTALFKLQWGNNLKKFQNVMLPGGIQIDGQTIYQEAEQEIISLKADMLDTYSAPLGFVVG